MTRLRIENYKGLREIDIPLSRFVCLIGENNTGKSSVLQALSLFFSGSSEHLVL
ncbi:MAG: ATP-binding protein, partial [Desulfobacterota bacterium]|nr:ATP-binding protein [Thermodesulfobacteriota bacterium]